MADQGLFHGDIVNSNRLLYTPSAFAKESLLHVQEIGTLKATKPHISKRENLRSYLFFIVRSGSGSLNYEGENYALTEGDCVFLDCRRSYAHETSKDLWQLSWIHFDGPALSQVYDKYQERGGLCVFRPKHLQHYLETYQELYQLVQTEDYVRDMRINETLSHFLVLLMKDSWHPENRANTKKTSLQPIKQYLEEHYREKITLDELAERYYINKYYLTRVFKEQYGISINTYLQDIRITKAKEYLRFTDLTGEEIAQRTGFGNGYYFSRVFAKVEGVSPMGYRKEWG